MGYVTSKLKRALVAAGIGVTLLGSARSSAELPKIDAKSSKVHISRTGILPFNGGTIKYGALYNDKRASLIEKYGKDFYKVCTLKELNSLVRWEALYLAAFYDAIVENIEKSKARPENFNSKAQLQFLIDALITGQDLEREFKKEINGWRVITKEEKDSRSNLLAVFEQTFSRNEKAAVAAVSDLKYGAKEKGKK